MDEVIDAVVKKHLDIDDFDSVGDDVDLDIQKYVLVEILEAVYLAGKCDGVITYLAKG